MAASVIQLLSQQVANKIAAGEVVDRPASVLKELVENAADAGATQIDVEIVAGGRKLISVTDNGKGMPRDDALLSIERHATSKIRDVDDIEKINTMGFRGEALAAISSVSRFGLKTCAAGEDHGTEVVITAGTIRDVRDIGFPQGSRVEVRDLFFNVPARRKFLRTHQTELSHARDAFLLLALANPGIGMRLTVDGRETYLLPGDSSLEDRLRDLFGPTYRNNLVPVDRELESIRVQGYISLPTVNRSDRKEQFVFINRRPATAAILGYAIREGYHSLLENGRHPSVFLYVTMDPGLVDVNVHPTKKEVRFRKPGDIRDLVIASIQDGLKAGSSAGSPRGFSGDRANVAPAAPAPVDRQLTIEHLPVTRSFRYPKIPLAQTPPLSAEDRAGKSTTTDPVTHAAPTDESSGHEAPWSWCRVLGQIGGLYVILETEDGMVIMDPHAAHERVLYDRFMRQVTDGAIVSQGLLVPQTVELQPADADKVRGNLDVLQSMGFGISEFGGEAFVVDALPACFSSANAEPMLLDMVESMERGGKDGARADAYKKAMATAACKAAVKANDHLTLEEIEQLVVDLAQTELPYTCPHGRPTLILSSYRELGRKFGRE
ncbi:MAG: DNA mismatch repair endonuclease MutL [Verrucomicrobia bacterium]|nr:DNA mismatch repair endonuclease MutL [Verrucomicrobiota bacterium]